MVCEWNAAVVAAVRADSAAPGLASRNLAIVHLAALDAAAHGDGAIAHACHRAAVALFPAHRARFDRQLAPHADGAGGDEGRAAADRLLAARAGDGASRKITYIPKDAPGKWRRTAPLRRPPELPHWPQVAPFYLEGAGQFRPPPPPAIGSPEFASAVAEVRRLGAKDARGRSAEQTEVAHFWSCFSYTATPAGHWNLIARDLVESRELDTRGAARLFALLNLALADAAIAAWDCKYHYEFWRPQQAIGGGWEPLLEAPPHPEYVSGHSTFGGAGAELLTRFFGTDEVAFTTTSDSLPGVERRFGSFSACAKEMGESRLYGGIHFRFSNERGLELGRKVAGWVFEHAGL